MGLLQPLPRPQGCIHYAWPTRWSRYLQDPREVEEDRQAHTTAVHAEHRRCKLEQGLPHTRIRQELHLIRRVQHGTVPAPWRENHLHEQPQRIQTTKTTATHTAAVR